MKKMLMIYNPLAGKGQIRNNLLDIIDVFSNANYEITVFPTRKKGDAVEATYQKAGDYEIVVCAGGDGTLDETVKGMMRREEKVPIGYIPAGSTNDFATSLELPKQMVRAAHTIIEGKIFACDIGRFNRDTFVYIAAFGIFTDVSYETNQRAKNVLGHMAYILEGMKRLTSIPKYTLSLFFVPEDGSEKQKIEGDFVFGMITNSHSVGGIRNITGEDVTLNDGLFEVTLVKTPKNPVELNQILIALSSKSVDDRVMNVFKTAYLEIETKQSVAWTLDGEYGGNHKKVTIINEKSAINIIVP